jgi:hypothetical protein
MVVLLTMAWPVEGWRDTLLQGNAITITAGLLVALAAYFLLRKETEKAVDYSVRPPEQILPGWQGKGLDNPSIKVAGSTAIQCYAPASGNFLGLVNPATKDRIDRTIGKAAAAQKLWSLSSFAQRRRVLKTLLKFILDN